MRRWLPLATLVLAAVALAGCADGGGDDTVATPTPTPPETPAPSPSPTATPSPSPEPRRDPVTWEVEVRDNSFAPAEMDIQAGDTVEWVRAGTSPHTVTADDGSFDSGDCPGLDCFTVAGRQSFSFTFEDVGDAAYFCEVHGGPDGAGMSGVVRVLERLDDTP